MTTTCVNDDGRPVCPPSKVLCKECLGVLGKKIEEIVRRVETRAQHSAINRREQRDR